MYEDDDVRNDLDDLYDKLDELVEFAEGSIERNGDSNKKIDASVDILNLMINEVPREDINIYQQIGESWVAEVRYRGINFIAIAGKTKPLAWDEWELEDWDFDE